MGSTVSCTMLQLPHINRHLVTAAPARLHTAGPHSPVLCVVWCSSRCPSEGLQGGWQGCTSGRALPGSTCAALQLQEPVLLHLIRCFKRASRATTSALPGLLPLLPNAPLVLCSLLHPHTSSIYSKLLQGFPCDMVVCGLLVQQCLQEGTPVATAVPAPGTAVWVRNKLP